MTVKEPQQLTLWPNDALPGQLPLFNRRARVRMLSEMASGYCVRCEAVVVRHFPGDLCFHCETVTAAFLASRKTLATSNSPAAEPIGSLATGSANALRWTSFPPPTPTYERPSAVLRDALPWSNRTRARAPDPLFRRRGEGGG